MERNATAQTGPDPRGPGAFRPPPSTGKESDCLPVVAGIGLREPHMAAFFADDLPAAWVEVHSENYMVPGGPRLANLERVRRDRPISCHGVALSLASAEGLDRNHLQRLRHLFDRFEPAQISEHLAWSVQDGRYLNDLLPIPYTRATLDLARRNIEAAQEALGRRLLVENPSTYIAFAGEAMPEAEFLAELVRRTGCGLLLDVNNIYVSTHNTGLNPRRYIDAIPPEAVGQFHLAGHARVRVGDEDLIIDDHGSRVSPPVWELFRYTLNRIGPRPTLMEWDTQLPDLAILLDEARLAQGALDQCAATEGERHHVG